MLNWEGCAGMGNVYGEKGVFLNVYPVWYCRVLTTWVRYAAADAVSSLGTFEVTH